MPEVRTHTNSPPPPAQAVDVLESLHALRARAERQESRQRLVWLLSVAVVGVLSVGRVTDLLEVQLRSESSFLAVMLLMALGYGGVFAGLVAARRWGSQALAWREDAVWLELARTALVQAGASACHPYRRGRLIGAELLVGRTTDETVEGLQSGLRDRRAARAWRAATATALAIAIGVLLVAILFWASRPVETRRWMFTEAAASMDDIGLRTPQLDAGAWHVTDDREATGGRALVNLAGVQPSSRALAVVGDVRARDLRVSTRCKVASRARSCGVAFRLQDSANYYVAYVDSVAREVCLAHVLDGTLRVLVRSPANVAAGVWQAITVEAFGRELRISWNGKTVVEVNDSALPSAGHVGLWVPSSDVALFDELTVATTPERPSS